MILDTVAFAEAILRLHKHGVRLTLLEAEVLVNWGRYVEILNAEDLTELARLARKYPIGGGVVLEMAWKLYSKDRKRGVEKAEEVTDRSGAGRSHTRA